MRVLQINKYNYLRGGSEAVFFNTIRMLEEHGHEVARMCVNHPKNDASPWSKYFVDAPEIREIQGIAGKLCSVPRFFVNRDAAKKIEQLINDFHPDIAHLHNIFNGISLAILPVLKRHGIPVVITMHDTRFICPSSSFNLRGAMCDDCLKKTSGLRCGLHRCYENTLVNSWMCAFEMFHKEHLLHYDRYIDRYIFVSQRYKDFHTFRHSYFGSKGVLLYNFAANIDAIVPNDKKGDYFLFYGRVANNKGIETLVNAMEQLPGLMLHVVGTGEMLDQLKARQLSNVKFLGYKSGDDLFDQVKNASFIVVPSEWEENNPMTIIEGYTYGKPVIGALIGGIPEIIKEGETGFTHQSFDRDSLAATIKQASEISAERYAQMSHNARTFAETHFAPEPHYRKLIAVYNELV